MDEIFTKIAQKNNTTKRQVKKEIEKAIDIAIKNSKGKPEKEKFWNEILQNDKKTETEKIIRKIADKIAKNYGAE